MGDDALNGVADQLLRGRDGGRKGVAVMGLLGQGRHMGEELPAP
jgi:hypothetical protein